MPLVIVAPVPGAVPLPTYPLQHSNSSVLNVVQLLPQRRDATLGVVVKSNVLRMAIGALVRTRTMSVWFQMKMYVATPLYYFVPSHDWGQRDGHDSHRLARLERRKLVALDFPSRE
jgi:hypothetical protein